MFQPSKITWTPLEVGWLKEKYKDHTIKFLAKQLNKTMLAVALKANLLNLKKLNNKKISYKIINLLDNSFDYIITNTPTVAIREFIKNEDINLLKCDSSDANFEVVFLENNNRIKEYYKFI